MAELDKHLGKYHLKSQLGHGGMGVVYLATDTRLKRDVALKILPRQLAADKAAVERFFQEARVVARLNHPNVVILHDVDQERGYSFLVMELLTGGSMADRVARGPLPWQEATRIIAQACRGLAAAQDAGLIHRDIKPSNIMTAANGVVKLTDFGLAKIVEDGDTTPIGKPGPMPLTQTGTIMGTPEYMSPEQCRGEPLDGRSDLYSLGATYFALLVGQPPYGEARMLQAMFAHCSRPTPNPCSVRADIPPACGAIVLKAMAKNRADRFATAHAMADALDQALAGAPKVAAIAPRGDEIRAVPAPAPPAPPAPTIPFVFESGPVAPMPAPSRPRRLGRRGITFTVAGVCAVLLAAILLVVFQPFRASDPDDPAALSNAIDLQPRAEFGVGNAPVRSVAFSHDSKSLYSGALDGSVLQWDVQGRNVLRRFAGTKQEIYTVAANARWLAAGGAAKCVWLWKLEDDQPHARLADFAGEVSALAFSPDGRRLAVGTYAEVKLYEITDKGASLVKVLGVSATDPMCYMVMSVAFSSDSRLLAATTWTNKRVLVWKASSGALQSASPEMAECPMSVAFLPASERLAVGLQYRGLALWDVGKAEVQMLRAGHDVPARSLVVTPHGRDAIFEGQWGGTLRIVDLASNAPAHVVPRSSGAAAVALALSPDGKLLASGGGDEAPGRGYLHLFDVVPRKVE